MKEFYVLKSSSNAFLVAEKLGFPKAVLDLATRYISDQGSGASRFIRDIEGLQEDLKKEREEIGVLKEEIQGHRDHLREKVGRIRERRKLILEEIQDRGRAILQQTEIELKRIAEEFAKGGDRRLRIPKGDLKKVREGFFLQFRSRGRKARDVAGLRVGDWVRVLSLNRVGIVSEVYGEANKADVRVESMKLNVPLRDLERSAPQPLAHDTINEGLKYEGAIEKAVRSEINVVGLTVEEALPVVDKFIDDAILSRLEKVDIIHGLGTGRLREAIGEHLKRHRNVKRSGPKDIMRSGVTVVEFC